MMKGRLSLYALAAVFAAVPVYAIEFGLLDDFDGDAMMCVADNWEEGGASPNPPIPQLGCGEAGSCCLRAISSGGFGPGSRQVVYNEFQWSGDYNAAGVNKIEMQVANASANVPIDLRVGVTNGLTCYVSTESVVLPANTPGPAGLVAVSFLLDNSTMTQVLGNNCGVGGDSLETVLSGVSQLRLLSATVPTWLGDPIISELQVDGIVSTGDSDFDGVNDDHDNCTIAANPAQIDSDQDGFGNLCDADLNNDCIVNASDLGVFKSVFFTADANADFDGNATVNFADLAILKAQFFAAPGPGLGDCPVRR